MTKKITCVVDNAVRHGSPFWGEHGLSFRIETDDGCFLFDTGRSESVLWHNLGLLDLFGLLTVRPGLPEAGKGWRITYVRRTALGDALLELGRHDLAVAMGGCRDDDGLDAVKRFPTIQHRLSPAGLDDMDPTVGHHPLHVHWSRLLHHRRYRGPRKSPAAPRCTDQRRRFFCFLP